MMKDPIVEEVRFARQRVFTDCNDDLDTLLSRFQDQEERDRERLVFDLSSQPDRDGRQLDGVHSQQP
jgi:hypothetical protein